MVSAKSIWGTMLFGGKLQIDAKKSSFEIFESALYMKSGSMPITCKHTTRFSVHKFYQDKFIMLNINMFSFFCLVTGFYLQGCLPLEQH